MQTENIKKSEFIGKKKGKHTIAARKNQEIKGRMQLCITQAAVLNKNIYPGTRRTSVVKSDLHPSSFGSVFPFGLKSCIFFFLTEHF